MFSGLFVGGDITSYDDSARSAHAALNLWDELKGEPVEFLGNVADSERLADPGITSELCGSLLRHVFFSTFRSPVFPVGPVVLDDWTTSSSTWIIELEKETPPDVIEAFEAIQGLDPLSEGAYDSAGHIADWVADRGSKAEWVLVHRLRSLREASAATIIAALADAEAQVCTVELIMHVRSYLFSRDKRLAQAAAALLQIGAGADGTMLVQDVLESETPPVHASLIRGILDILG